MLLFSGLDTDILSYFDNKAYVDFMVKIVTNNENELANVKANLNKKTADQIVPIIPTIPPIRQLIELPDDYSDLINSVSLFTCPNNERDDSRNPTMCLVCGEILCSQSYCCQKDLDRRLVGACTYHVHSCGAGNIFQSFSKPPI
jgi:E3 ubiquitin-protein ligase UBR2